MRESIRRVLRDHARLVRPIDGMADEADLYEAGMTSHASVNVMLALEGELGVRFPDRMLRRGVFESIVSIEAAAMEAARQAMTRASLVH